jgi:hypothetical protein
MALLLDFESGTLNQAAKRGKAIGQSGLRGAERDVQNCGDIL